MCESKEGEEDLAEEQPSWIMEVGIDCIFKGRNRSRAFTTPGNFEAANLLANKLEKMGVGNKRGRLIFQFEEDIPSEDLEQ